MERIRSLRTAKTIRLLLTHEQGEGCLYTSGSRARTKKPVNEINVIRGMVVSQFEFKLRLGTAESRNACLALVMREQLRGPLAFAERLKAWDDAGGWA